MPRSTRHINSRSAPGLLQASLTSISKRCWISYLAIRTTVCGWYALREMKRPRMSSYAHTRRSKRD